MSVIENVVEDGKKRSDPSSRRLNKLDQFKWQMNFERNYQFSVAGLFRRNSKQRGFLEFEISEQNWKSCKSNHSVTYISRLC